MVTWDGCTVGHMQRWKDGIGDRECMAGAGTPAEAGANKSFMFII